MRDVTVMTHSVMNAFGVEDDEGGWGDEKKIEKKK